MSEETYIHYLYCNTDSDVSNPEKFSYTKWEIWGNTVRNWLYNKIVVTNLPLSYLICKDTTPPTMDHSELIIYNAILTTSIFINNSSKVENILRPLVLNTDAFEWGGRKFTQVKGR